MKLIGTISLTQMRENKANLGYWIGVPFLGKGYCTEAAKALITFAFKGLSLEMVYAIHLEKNPASGKVMLNSGMQYVKSTNIDEKPFHYYEIARSKWLSHNISATHDK